MNAGMYAEARAATIISDLVATEGPDALAALAALVDVTPIFGRTVHDRELHEVVWFPCELCYGLGTEVESVAWESRAPWKPKGWGSTYCFFHLPERFAWTLSWWEYLAWSNWNPLRIARPPISDGPDE